MKINFNEGFSMKKVFLCVLLVALSISVAWGNATEDLVYAVMDKNTTPRQVTALINAGADVNLRNKDGKTALMLAVVENDIEVIKTLIHFGADLTIKDVHG